MPKMGDCRLIAEWFVEIGGDENGVDPDKCKRGEAIVDGDLDLALHVAAQWDLNAEGTVREEAWSGEVWHIVERYTCYGERLFN